MHLLSEHLLQHASNTAHIKCATHHMTALINIITIFRQTSSNSLTGLPSGPSLLKAIPNTIEHVIIPKTFIRSVFSIFAQTFLEFFLITRTSGDVSLTLHGSYKLFSKNFVRFSTLPRMFRSGTVIL